MNEQEVIRELSRWRYKQNFFGRGISSLLKWKNIILFQFVFVKCLLKYGVIPELKKKWGSHGKETY